MPKAQGRTSVVTGSTVQRSAGCCRTFAHNGARAGAEQLYRAYKEIGLTLEDLEGPRFMRIRHVKKLHEAGYLDASLRWSAGAEETVTQGGIAHA